ncbi:SHOCT domain-containing protein [Spirosoma aerolatum]|uniref:SHOCT domain-containing protein n=1 Tax=Spirosoma aerolatum TaxID=1211326 RepID=UPI001C54E0A9|nr:SHOCT domain-containing protein [Spirosoma aerolatum]
MKVILKGIAAGLFVTALVNPLVGFSQTGPVTADEIKNERVSDNRLQSGYQTSVAGWVVKLGDTLTFGRGTMPTKAFAFIYDNAGGVGGKYVNGQLVRTHLTSDYAGKRGIVKELVQSGTRKQGFSMGVVVGVGTLTRYYIELENAIAEGEIASSAGARPKSAGSVSVADELLKLKQLLDAGALTQKEFDDQKKKLLNQ